MSFINISALALAMVLNPWLLARHLAPKAGWASALALWGAACVGLNTLAPLLLHLAHIPISSPALVTAHAGAAALFMIVGVARFLPWFPFDPRRCPHLFVSLLVFAVLVLPVSHIAGIDTYKWQDLASAVQVEHGIPWLIHPVSLFGFTPRSYPSSQPLILASIQMLGGVGVDWGFYILSVVLGATGLFGAFRLGQRLFDSDRPAFWFASLYLFSPVFLRYNYWATGRGLLMDLLPLFILALLQFRRMASIAGAVVMAVLLALAHKAGFVAVVLIPVVFAFSWLLAPFAWAQRWRSSTGKGGRMLRHPDVPQPTENTTIPAVSAAPTLLAFLLLLALAAGALLANGAPMTVAFRVGSRLGVLLPLAVVGWFWPPAGGIWLSRPAWRAMFAGCLVTLPLVFASDMYGALLALPFVALPAVAGLERLTGSAPLARARLIRIAVVVLTLGSGLGIIAHQAKDSPPDDAYRAALVLEQRDPLGPYRLEAPGRLRTQMQAYLSGCPRFTVSAPSEAHFAAAPFPRRTGVWAEDFRHAIAWLRSVLSLADVSTEWYGTTDRVYYVRFRGQGVVPPQAPLVTRVGDVAIYGPPPP